MVASCLFTTDTVPHALLTRPKLLLLQELVNTQAAAHKQQHPESSASSAGKPPAASGLTHVMTAFYAKVLSSAHLLYWYKSTNSDAGGAARLRPK